MQYTKFVVKVSRTGALRAEYVQRIDHKPLQTTLEPKLALLMGKVTAMEVLQSLQKSKWSPELVAVQMHTRQTTEAVKIASYESSLTQSAPDPVA